MASWYGPGFHGKRTSNGEIYNQYALTAAHKTLPAGTRLTVTNLDNQQTVEVRVNDRGPFVGERILDLSFAGAKALGMIGSGTAPVRIEVLGATGESLPSVGYAVQVGSFSDEDNANRLHRKLATNLDRVYVIEAEGDDATVFRVRIGPYDRREQARRRASEVRAMGWFAIIMEETVALR